MPMNDGSYMKKKAKSALAPWRDKEEPKQNFNMLENRAANADEEAEKPVEDEEGSDEPADVSGLAKEEKKKEKSKDSGWGKKVIAAIVGIGGAVAGANLQHKQNQRREKIYQAKRKTGNYL